MISDEELDLMKRQNERNAKYLHRMGRDGVRANRHRATLLAEVERQRAEIERLREALGGIRIDGPDADGLVWAIIQHPDIAARSRVAVYPVGKTIRYLCSNLPDGRILMEPEVEECAPELERLRAEIDGLRAQMEERYISMRVRQLEEALDAERQTARWQRAENERLRAEIEALHEALRRGAKELFVVERRTTGPDTPVAFIREGKP